MQRTAFGTGFEWRTEGAFEVEMNDPTQATINTKQIMTSASSSPAFNSYVVLSPAAGTITHDAVNPITFNASGTPQSPQWSLNALGAGFTLKTPGLYRFEWGFNNNGANSSFFLAHLINAAQFITEQWATSATPLVGVQDSHLFNYSVNKTTSSATLDAHTFTLAGATAADANTTIGLIGLNIIFLPTAATFSPH